MLDWLHLEFKADFVHILKAFLVQLIQVKNMYFELNQVF